MLQRRLYIETWNMIWLAYLFWGKQTGNTTKNIKLLLLLLLLSDNSGHTHPNSHHFWNNRRAARSKDNNTTEKLSFVSYLYKYNRYVLSQVSLEEEFPEFFMVWCLLWYKIWDREFAPFIFMCKRFLFFFRYDGLLSERWGRPFGTNWLLSSFPLL